MSSADDQRASDDLVHRLAAKMASADHGTLPSDPADADAAPRTRPRAAAPAGEGVRGAGGGGSTAVVDLTDASTGTAVAGDDEEDAVDLGDLVIDLDTYEAAHQLAVEEERSY